MGIVENFALLIPRWQAARLNQEQPESNLDFGAGCFLQVEEPICSFTKTRCDDICIRRFIITHNLDDGIAWQSALAPGVCQ